MGLVAIVAGHAAGVFGGHDLWEALRLRGVLFMASRAEGGNVRESGFESGRIVGVFGERAVTGFAGDVGVFAGGADGGFGIVARAADVLSGVLDGLGSGHGEVSGAVVAILSKSFGDDRGADHKKQDQTQNQDHRGADQMACISKTGSHRNLLLATGKGKYLTKRYDFLK
jgi:hypothetical protein